VHTLNNNVCMCVCVCVVVVVLCVCCSCFCFVCVCVMYGKEQTFTASVLYVPHIPLKFKALCEPYYRNVALAHDN